MDTQETIQVLQKAHDEITMLRARIAALEPKAHAYDSVSQVLAMLPKPSQGYGEDVAWTLRKAIAEEQSKKADTASDKPAAE